MNLINHICDNQKAIIAINNNDYDYNLSFDDINMVSTIQSDIVISYLIDFTARGISRSLDRTYNSYSHKWK